jgi:hypothetical protein
MLEAAFLGLIPDTQLYKDLTVQSYPSMTLSGARPNQLLGINDLIDWPRTLSVLPSNRDIGQQGGHCDTVRS